MDHIFINLFGANANQSIAIFRPYDDSIGLQWPLNSSYIFRIALALTLVFALVFGTHLRIKIMAFLLSPESSTESINILSLLDQLSQLCHGVIISKRYTSFNIAVCLRHQF